MDKNQLDKSVEKINESLSLFVGEIGTLVEDIDEQYNVLEFENKQFSKAVQDSGDAKLTIKEVASVMADTSEKLMIETKKISDAFINIQSLAVIAEENSASAEQVSSNVSIYTEQIKELTHNINGKELIPILDISSFLIHYLLKYNLWYKTTTKILVVKTQFLIILFLI